MKERSPETKRGEPFHSMRVSEAAAAGGVAGAVVAATAGAADTGVAGACAGVVSDRRRSSASSRDFSAATSSRNACVVASGAVCAMAGTGMATSASAPSSERESEVVGIVTIRQSHIVGKRAPFRQNKFNIRQKFDRRCKCNFVTKCVRPLRALRQTLRWRNIS